jgi:hypothetical protein
MKRSGPKPGLTLIIGNPAQNGQINIGEKLTVSGLVGGRGGAEPTVPQSVTVQLGDLPPVQATLKPPRFPQRNTAAPNWTFTAVFDSVTLPPGPTILSAEAFFASNEHVVVEQTVLASLGGAPLESTFTAHVTLLTSSSAAAGPFHDTIPIGALFSGDRTSVVFNFPPLSIGGATVTLIAGGVGTLDVTTLPVVSGVMNIPVTLKFSQELNGDSTLSITLTTRAEQSPQGKFKDTGTPLDAAGNIKLVGDGSFVGGNILDGSDASLVLNGAFSPAPIQPPGRLP